MTSFEKISTETTATAKAIKSLGMPLSQQGWFSPGIDPSGETRESNLLWSRLRQAKIDEALVESSRLVTIDRSNPAYLSFDMLRTRVLQSLRHNNWTSVAITAPTDGCGKSLVAMNLAFSLAHQPDCRTLLIDLDLRRPSIGTALGLRGGPCMEAVLRGEIDVERAFVRFGDNLAVATSDKPVPFAAELLQSPVAARTLTAIKQRLRPNVVLFDLPPMLANDDVTAFLPNVDCALMIVAAGETTRSDADVCEAGLSQNTKVLGIVLNKCQHMAPHMNY